MKFVYRVKANDTILSIANNFSLSPDDLLAVNQIKRENVVEGTLLLIEKKQGVKYVVKPFDSIESIAKEFGISSKVICEYNDIDRVFLGEVIYIPIKKN